MTGIPMIHTDHLTSYREDVSDTGDDLVSPSKSGLLATLAKRLSARPYLTMFERLPTDNGVLAWHPEFTSENIRCCTATGCTEAEASDLLEAARYSLILALLATDLPVPDPISDTVPYVFPEKMSLPKSW